MRFDTRVAIVTGAANGIGRATAIRLAEEGAKVAVLDLNDEKIAETVAIIEEGGGIAMGVALDISKSVQVKSAVHEVLANFGQIDILVNCAGAGWQRQNEFKDMCEGDWEWIIDVNLKGTLYCTHAVLDHMVDRQYGRIVNVASIAAKVGIPKLAIYAATKGAVVSFTKSIAMEMGPHAITVNCVSPGLVAQDEGKHPSTGTFLGRAGTPREMASVIVFLASDEAAFVTGADYLVDGGRTLGPRGA